MSKAKYPIQLESNERGERWRLAGNEIISEVHSVDVCEPPCPLHAPTEHAMRTWRLHYNHDQASFERIKDGIAVFDPDSRRPA